MLGRHNPRVSRLARRALAAGLCFWLGGALCVLTCEFMPAEAAAITLGLASHSGQTEAAAPANRDCCHPSKESGGKSPAVSGCAMLAQPLDAAKKVALEPLIVAVALEAPRAPEVSPGRLATHSPSGWPPDTVPLFLRNRVLLI